jgi:Pyruvate/2-oxoacid:ferredoxin oxidoreductase delta subunit
MGPPICDELIALVQHMFTEEEASLVRYLRALPGKTAAAVAAAAHRPVEEVRPILERLALEKFVLLSSGTGDKERYHLLPLMPGAFEMVLVRTSLNTLTDWHRRFAELIEALYETGYFVDYAEHPFSTVRYVPVGQTIEAHPMALPSDRLEEILDRYEVFAVGLCQCRMAQEIVGRGCGRSMENCVGFGDAAELLIRHGRMRRVEKKDVLEIKAEAEAAGLATWMFETELGKSSSGASCSCCGCCCDALRTISQFNAPGMIAPPHFMPKVDLTKCMYCGKCAKICPVGAVVVDTKGKSHQHLRERCIGCGLCAVACDKQHAIQMDPTPKYREPPRSLISALFQIAPNYLRSAWSVWRKYR